MGLHKDLMMHVRFAVKLGLFGSRCCKLDIFLPIRLSGSTGAACIASLVS